MSDEQNWEDKYYDVADLFIAQYETSQLRAKQLLEQISKNNEYIDHIDILNEHLVYQVKVLREEVKRYKEVDK